MLGLIGLLAMLRLLRVSAAVFGVSVREKGPEASAPFFLSS